MLIKLSAKSYSFDILCTVDVFGALLRLGNGCASRGKVFNLACFSSERSEIGEIVSMFRLSITI